MRKYGVKNPYELLKDLTRGKSLVINHLLSLGHLRRS